MDNKDAATLVSAAANVALYSKYKKLVKERDEYKEKFEIADKALKDIQDALDPETPVEVV